MRIQLLQDTLSTTHFGNKIVKVSGGTVLKSVGNVWANLYFEDESSNRVCFTRTDIDKQLKLTVLDK